MSPVPPTLLVLTLLFGAYTSFFGCRLIKHIAVILLLFEYLFLLNVSQLAAIFSIIMLTLFFAIAKNKHKLAQWAYLGMRLIVCTGTILALSLFVYFALNATLDMTVVVSSCVITLGFVVLFWFCEDRVSFIVCTTTLGTVIMVSSVALWNNETLQFEIWHLPFALFVLLVGAAIQWQTSLLQPVLQEGVLWITPRSTDATEPATPTPKHEEPHHVV